MSRILNLSVFEIWDYHFCLNNPAELFLDFLLNLIGTLCYSLPADERACMAIVSWLISVINSFSISWTIFRTLVITFCSYSSCLLNRTLKVLFATVRTLFHFSLYENLIWNSSAARWQNKLLASLIVISVSLTWIYQENFCSVAKIET